ncbi:MAG: hypothetical protein WC955_04270 [Elusimicrobiota bacterium]
MNKLFTFIFVLINILILSKMLNAAETAGLQFVLLTHDPKTVALMDSCVSQTTRTSFPVELTPAVNTVNNDIVTELSSTYLRGLSDSYGYSIKLTRTLAYNGTTFIFWKTGYSAGEIHYTKLDKTGKTVFEDSVNAESSGVTALTLSPKLLRVSTALISTGITLKYVESTLAQCCTVNTLLADTGINCIFTQIFPIFSLGITLNNAGFNDYSYDTIKESPPTLLRAAVGLQAIPFLPDCVTTIAYHKGVNSNNEWYSAGCENRVSEKLLIRFGLKLYDGYTTYAAGGSLRIRNFVLDYTVNTTVNGTMMHRAGINYSISSAVYKETIDDIYNKGVEYFESGDYVNASIMFAEVITKTPEHADAVRMLTIIGGKLK